MCVLGATLAAGQHSSWAGSWAGSLGAAGPEPEPEANITSNASGWQGGAQNSTSDVSSTVLNSNAGTNTSANHSSDVSNTTAVPNANHSGSNATAAGGPAPEPEWASSWQGGLEPEPEPEPEPRSEPEPEPATVLTLRLAFNYTVLAQHPAAMVAFKVQFRHSVGAAINVSAAHIHIMSLTPGSVIVNFTVLGAVGGSAAVLDAFANQTAPGGLLTTAALTAAVTNSTPAGAFSTTTAPYMIADGAALGQITLTYSQPLTGTNQAVAVQAGAQMQALLFEPGGRSRLTVPSGAPYMVFSADRKSVTGDMAALSPWSRPLGGFLPSANTLLWLHPQSLS